MNIIEIIQWGYLIVKAVVFDQFNRTFIFTLSQ
mgnify:CR=1 FL=1